MRSLLIWTAAEVILVAVASLLWGFQTVYEWRTHNSWVAIPLLAFAVFALWKKYHSRKETQLA